MIAYYAHSHGFGHSNSGSQFCSIFRKNSVLITASAFDFKDNFEVVHIASEDCDYNTYKTTTYNLPRYAHYLPKSLPQLVYRNFQILEACLEYQVSFALVDVSVETAAQFRVAGIPYAYHKMFGERTDEAHSIAYSSSEFLYAFYPSLLEIPDCKVMGVKTHYLGFISRFKFRRLRHYKINVANDDLKILIIVGKGGTCLDLDKIKNLRKQLPNAKFTVVGLNSNKNKLKHIEILKFSQGLDSLMLKNDIVISSCGLNMTAEVLAVKNRFIAIAENRPFNEQKLMCKSLIKHKLVVAMDFQDIKKTVEEFNRLPFYKNLRSLFGSMKNFKNVEQLKPYLK